MGQLFVFFKSGLFAIVKTLMLNQYSLLPSFKMLSILKPAKIQYSGIIGTIIEMS